MVAWPALWRLIEIGTARILPGALNAASIVLTAGALNREAYGQFSITLATVTSVSAALFGPISQAIVPLHSKYVEIGEHRELERGLMGLTLALALLMLLACAGAAARGLMTWQSAALLIGFSLFSTWQQVLQARLNFWSYGAAALCQGVLLIVLIYGWKSATATPEAAILTYSVSYAAGFLLCWLISGAIVPTFPPIEMVRKIFSLGTSLTLSTLAESLLFLGFRYAIQWLGSPAFLGIFSLALDLAQRSVGVIINIASFAVVPMAYRLDAKGAKASFRRLLLRSAVLAGGSAAAVLAALVMLEATGHLPGIETGKLSATAFCAVSVGIVINRIKKMAIDPLLVSAGMAFLIPFSYLALGVPTLALAILLLYLGHQNLILLLYPLSYAGVAMLCGFLHKSRVAGT